MRPSSHSDCARGMDIDVTTSALDAEEMPLDGETMPADGGAAA